MKIAKLFILAASITVCTAGCVKCWALMPYYTDARAEGLGGACASLARGSSALYYNPAGLSGTAAKEVSALYWKDHFDTGYSFLSFGMPLENIGGVAFGWSRSANTFEKTDAWGRAFGTGEVTGDIFMAGAGFKNWLGVPLGITVKYISERIDVFSASGWSLDAGAMYGSGPFALGLYFRNAVNGGLSGDSAAGSKVTEKIPVSARFGCSVTNKQECAIPSADGNCREIPEKLGLMYVISADVSVSSDDPGEYRLSPGAELWLNDSVGLRAGMRELRDYTAGISVYLGNFRMDYAFIISKELENGHILSTSIFF